MTRELLQQAIATSRLRTRREAIATALRHPLLALRHITGKGLNQIVAATVIVFTLCVVVSSALTIFGNTVDCRLVVPRDDGRCCQCICDANSTWCASDDARSGTRPRALFGPENEAKYQRSLSFDMLLWASPADVGGLLSSLLVLVLILIARRGSNWYLVLCIDIIFFLEVGRIVTFHLDPLPSATLTNARYAFDLMTILCTVFMTVLTPILKPRYNTLLFLQYGAALSSQQDTIRTHQILFAATVTDWQLMNVFYVDCMLIFRDENSILLALLLMIICENLSLYLSYHYVRFEQRWETILANVTKAILAAVGWGMLVVTFFHCYSTYASRASFLMALQLPSTFLPLDAISGEHYLFVGSCGAASSINSAGDAAFVLAILLTALFFRLLSLFYGGLLVMSYGKGQVMSLFYEQTVTARQLPLPQSTADTL